MKTYILHRKTGVIIDAEECDIIQTWPESSVESADLLTWHAKAVSQAWDEGKAWGEALSPDVLFDGEDY